MLWQLTLIMFRLAPMQAQAPEVSIPALIQEVRQLRNDLRTLDVAAQRTQLVLYRIRVQQQALAVRKAVHKDARNNLLRGEWTSRTMAETAKHVEERLAISPPGPARTFLEQHLAQTKKNLLEAEEQEPTLRAAEAYALAALNNEIATLDELYAKLAEITKQFEVP